MTMNVDGGVGFSEPDFGAAPQSGITRFSTTGGIEITRTVTSFEPAQLADVTKQVDDRRGGVFSSGMEYPGRYSRWHTGYVDPCVEFTSLHRQFTATALNDRGHVLLPAITAALLKAGHQDLAARSGAVSVIIPEPAGQVPEEQRSRRPTVFSAIREVIALFASPDPQLALFGAFGYDLAFQFEPIRLRPGRDASQRDLVLHLPDQLYVIDRKRETALRYDYEFAVGGRSTEGLPRQTPLARPASVADDSRPGSFAPAECPADPTPGEYAKVVEQARERFAVGDLFEVVPGHEFWARCGSPAAFYERLRRRNPAPYEFFLNLGDGEYLVGASPEMYVRVTAIAGQYRKAEGAGGAGGRPPAGQYRVETCPISGTVARGDSPLTDAENIRTLLSSAKEESELTMCTDVDRNDKSRICVPGSVKVIGRRQIELYSRVIHTVDHVEGRLRPEFDALDAFLTHMWAVTVTGAPKTWAMQFIEDHETSPRRWYGGAVGALGFDGTMNTGLTLRTAQIRDGLACVRAGATLLFDSDPAAEEHETRLKARALLEVLAETDIPDAQSNHVAKSPTQRPVTTEAGQPGPGTGRKVLLVDHQDSFVHTLGGYFAEQGAQVTTLRAGFDPALLDDYAPDLVVLSPGPGRPSDFGCSKLLDELDARRLPVFGVCLGLQAMVEHSAGTLSLLRSPSHGKPGTVRVLGGDLFAGLPAEFTAGRYHSLHATPDQIGAGFTVTALTTDPAATADVVMAIEDPVARRWAVQFHPESILTASGDAGRRIIANVLTLCN